MNERVTVIEGEQGDNLACARIPMGHSLEDYHNGWTFEISTIARLYFDEVFSRIEKFPE